MGDFLDPGFGLGRRRLVQYTVHQETSNWEEDAKINLLESPTVR
jgi:hypothetical protein